MRALRLDCVSTKALQSTISFSNSASLANLIMYLLTSLAAPMLLRALKMQAKVTRFEERPCTGLSPWPCWAYLAISLVPETFQAQST